MTEKTQSEKVAEAFEQETMRWKEYQQNRIKNSMKNKLERAGYDPEEWDLSLGIYTCPHGHFVKQEDKCPHGCEVPENNETIDFGEIFPDPEDETDRPLHPEQEEIESFKKEKVIA